MTKEEEIAELKDLVVKLTKENVELKAKKSAPGQTMLFSDFMIDWVQKMKSRIRENSWESYRSQVTLHIAPWFAHRQTMLSQVTTGLLEDYYSHLCDIGLSPATIAKHHSNIHAALRYAAKHKLIEYNPASLADKPKISKFVVEPLSDEQMLNLFSALKKASIFTPVFLSAVLGLRRSEVLGLRWDAIDFKKNTIEIRHTVVKSSRKGETAILRRDMAKNDSSIRTIMLPKSIKEYLRCLRFQQLDRARSQDDYNTDDFAYVCVDEKGKLFKPDCLTNTFSYAAKKVIGRSIRFHDLRHSCASLLVSNGMPLKTVSMWLGHSSERMTSRYVHLYPSDARNIANCIDTSLIPSITQKRSVPRDTLR